MSDHHFVQLVIDGGELHRRFVCTAPADAPCRRPDLNGECWAEEWCNAVGIEDAIAGKQDGVLASVPVHIEYSEGVWITPTGAAFTPVTPVAPDGRCEGPNEYTEYAICGDDDGEPWVVPHRFQTEEEARAWLAGPTASWARRAGGYIAKQTIAPWKRVTEEGAN